MNILQVISSTDPQGGGPVEVVTQLGTVLSHSGVRVEVASIDPPEAPYLKRYPFPIHPLGPGRLKYAFSPRLVPWLRANHRRYDAVIVNGLWQFHGFATWRVLRNSSTPYFVFTHGMLDPWFKKRYPAKHIKKWMYWPWAEYRVLRDAQAVLFACETERALARESFPLYRCNEIVVNFGIVKPNGDRQLMLQDFFARFPGLRGKKLALFMGRIHPKKGCDLLIEAFAKTMASLPGWHLVIAGPDQVGWRAQLQGRAEQLGLSSQITWTGMLTGTLKWGALEAADIFVLPSHQENFGVAVIEAMAAGVPALISKRVNIWQEIEADGAGITADDTVEGTCALLNSYVDLPQDKKATMSQKARQCFDHRFDMMKAGETLRALLTPVRSSV